MTLSPIPGSIAAAIRIGLTIAQLLQQILYGEARGAGARDELAHELSELALTFEIVALHLLITDKRAGPLLGLEGAADFELAVGPHYGIGVDGQVHRDLADRGELISANERPGRDAAHH